MSARTTFRQIRVASLLLVVLVAACASQTKNVTITTVPPGAEIELDGVAIGTSPISRTLKFNEVPEHQVVASEVGYDKALGKIAYEPTDKMSYELELAELAKLLLITSEPPGATVHLDGSEIGLTPQQKDLSFARIPEHLVMVTKEGSEDSGVRLIRYEPSDSQRRGREVRHKNCSCGIERRAAPSLPGLAAPPGTATRRGEPAYVSLRS